MFEKEAEEYREEWQNKGYYFVSQEMEQIELDDIVDATFKDGAEFGYNKALEEATHNYNAIIADYDKRIAELKKENADLEIYNEELLDDDIEKHSKIVALEKENAELKMQLGEWKKCFLSCSSPFCSKHFPTVESSGVLGNMEKKENLKRGTK